MGCGSSGHVAPTDDANGATGTNGTNGAHGANGTSGANGTHANGNGKANGKSGHHDDDLPTVVLPETPARPKPPIAFEIPLEEFDAHQRSSPPPHLQRLLQPPQPEVSLPHIEEKLAEAEMRRQTILQQRAASAQKKAQRLARSFQEMDGLDSEHEFMDTAKHAPKALTIPLDAGQGKDKNI